MATSTITYNGFTFPYTKLRVTEEPVWSEDRITLVGTNYRFSVDGVLTAATPTAFNTLLNTMRCQLRPPRKSLSISWKDDIDSDEEYWTFGTDNVTDDSWGPTPGELSLISFSGGISAIYGWNITAFRKDCFGSTCTPAATQARSSEVLSITRRYDFSIDTNGFTTRTISGKLLTTTEGTPADQFRYYVEPDSPTNFQRTAQSFSQSEDGRVLSFSFTDVEQMYTLPDPITGGNATYSVRTDATGAISTITLSGSFEAPSGVSKNNIVACIQVLAADKFNLSGGASVVPLSTEISTSIYSNKVDFNLSATAAVGNSTGNSGTTYTLVGIDKLVASPPNSNGRSHALTPFGGDSSGTSGVIAAKPVIYDACTTADNDSGGADQIPSAGTGDVGGNHGSISEPAGNYPNTGISDDHAQNPYKEYVEKVSYEFDSGLVFLYPKQSGASPIRQQVRNPRLIVIQAGFFKQYRKADEANGPAAPKKIGGESDYDIISSTIMPEVPQPVGDGSWNLFTLRWRYVLHYTNSIDDAPATEVEMAYPIDPRRSSSTAISIDSANAPDLVVIPSSS